MLIIREMMPNNRLISSVNVSDGGVRKSGSYPSGTRLSTSDSKLNTISQCGELFAKINNKKKNVDTSKKDYDNYKSAVSFIDSQITACNNISTLIDDGIVKLINKYGTIAGKPIDSNEYGTTCLSKLEEYQSLLSDLKSEAVKYEEEYKNKYETLKKEYDGLLGEYRNLGC